MANILVIEDEAILARNICESLELAGHVARCVRSGEEGIQTATTDRPDLILTDLRLPGIDGLQVVRSLRTGGPIPAFIVMSAHGEISTAVEAMKAGATDFLTKPIDLGALRLIVQRAIDRQDVADELRYFKDREQAKGTSDNILGESEPMRRVKTLMGRIAATPALAADNPPNILITGETGTGKGLIARAIHYAGPRHGKKFVHLNCTAIPDHLAESELFGHVKGAFTDAKTEKRGLFELADHGTLFLDEIGHMPHALQAKLLDVLERRHIRPVGGTRDRAVDVHVIAATNRDLAEAIGERDFREDLYHRLRVLTVELPPLRDRGPDIAQLAHHFLNQATARFGLGACGFSDAAISAFDDYDWPGNVRELMHTIESAALIVDGSVVGLEHINLKLPDQPGAMKVALPSSDRTITVDFSGDGPKLDEIENEIIRAALEYSDHNLSRAARVLGISRDAIRYRLDKFDRKDGQTVSDR